MLPSEHVQPRTPTAARPVLAHWRTLLSAVWMRDRRRGLRGRADQLVVGLLSLLMIVVLSVAMALVTKTWQRGLVPLPLLLYALALTWLRAVSGKRRVVDLREGGDRRDSIP